MNTIFLIGSVKYIRTTVYQTNELMNFKIFKYNTFIIDPEHLLLYPTLWFSQD